MKYNSIFPLFLCLLINGIADAQVSIKEKPVSFLKDLKCAKVYKELMPMVTMPEIDMEKLLKEDEENSVNGAPYRFGFKHKVNFNLGNSGVWYMFSNGDKLWQLNIVCPKALSVNLCYDKFWIPEGGKFFIYTKDKKRCIGAFTSKNNAGDKNDLQGFATEIVYGNDVLLEYYQPVNVIEDAVISIEYVVHGYRDAIPEGLFLGSSGSCQTNVNCPYGANWKNEKNAVAYVTYINAGFTGALVNTTDYSQKPYFLTADHCFTNNDANTNPYLFSSCIFYWNYEAPSCDNISDLPAYYTTSGGTLVANNQDSDFALIRLTNDPKNIPGYTPYYLGWDHSGNGGTQGACIHHPSGDIKKICTAYSLPMSTNCLENVETNSGHYWRIAWYNGALEHGSSGSPLLNGEHNVIGQSTSATTSCSHPLSGYDWFGKFDVSWTGNGNSNTYRRLNCWLDSLGTGQQTVEGLLVVSNSHTISTNGKLYGKIRITNGGQLTLQGNIEIMGSSLTVESGGTLIIDGGTLTNVNLVLNPGSDLQITNGGSIEHRSDFYAPAGADVCIDEGQIL